MYRLSSQDTHPGQWRQADPIQFTDGCFQRDGLGIVVSDIAGQIHFYSLLTANHVMQTAPNDRLYRYDDDKEMMSVKREQVDVKSGELQHSQGARHGVWIG